MDLTRLTQLKTNSLNESFDQLKDLNGIVGIMDNTATSLSSLLALAIPNQNAARAINLMDDVYGAYPNNAQNSTSFPSDLGYLFDLKQDYILNLQSDITDHYTEENFVVHDHVANKPVKFTLTGKFSEVTLNNNTKINQGKGKGETDDPVKGALNMVDSMVDKAGSITQFAPGLTNSILALKNTAGKAYGLVNNVKNLAKVIKDSKSTDEKGDSITKSKIDDLEGKQHTGVRKYFYTWWKNKTPFVLLTPFGAFSNMYIENFIAKQDEKTRYVTDVQIVFKELRVATTKTYKPTSSNRRALQEDKAEAIEQTNDVSVMYFNESVGAESRQKVYAIEGRPLMDKSISGLSLTDTNRNTVAKLINSSGAKALTGEDIGSNSLMYSVPISGTGTSAGQIHQISPRGSK